MGDASSYVTESGLATSFTSPGIIFKGPFCFQTGSISLVLCPQHPHNPDPNLCVCACMCVHLSACMHACLLSQICPFQGKLFLEAPQEAASFALPLPKDPQCGFSFGFEIAAPLCPRLSW